ncbi:MAG: hypothetical protein EOO74_10585 [Myxococcales bacterium]|nr:MAG: hypothetical protein EOO74_10585 [Myxococcales bacterium]
MLTSPASPPAPGALPGPTVHVIGKLPPKVTLRAVHVIDPDAQSAEMLIGLDDPRLGSRLDTPTQLALRLEGARFVYFQASGGTGPAVELVMRVQPEAETEVTTPTARLRFRGLERVDLPETGASARLTLARRFAQAYGVEVQAAAAKLARGQRRTAG